MVSFGDRGRDIITGFVGVVTGRCEYISGCTQLLLSPMVSGDGAHREPAWFDDQRIEVIETEVVKLDNGATPGFDKAAPIR